MYYKSTEEIKVVGGHYYSPISAQYSIMMRCNLTSQADQIKSLGVNFHPVKFVSSGS